MKEKEELYQIGQDTLIASVLEGLISITFSDTKENKELYKKFLEFKLSMLMPKSLETSEDKLLCTLIVFSAGYAELEVLEVKALQMLKNIGLDCVYAQDITKLPRNEETLRILVMEIILPSMIGLGVDLDMEFKELEGMRTFLNMK